MKNVPHPDYPPTLGAQPLEKNRCRFRVWAPKVGRLELRIVAPSPRLLPMKRVDGGYFELIADDVGRGARYLYRLDGERDRPDPASRSQPDGVHLASEVVSGEFDWHDDEWHGLSLYDFVTYELHVGTFTPEGTFAAAIGHLDELRDLGVTAIELMPVAQFPGARNWGYDGVHLFAVQNTYGGPHELRRFVDACHQRGLAVVLDVVYNHLGPEGNYLAEFAHYFTDRHRTPWGRAINVDGPESDHVRRFFIENALSWIEEFHIDALRLDAVHAIFDNSARPFLQELADAVRLEGDRLNRRVYTIAESSLADPRIIEPAEVGGYGLDAQWCDDLHHSLRTLLTHERHGYYADFHGFDDLVKAYRDGFVLDGQISEYRGRRHGRPLGEFAPIKLCVCSQNHDQVGNRVHGDRLSRLVSFEELKVAAATVLLSPFQPLLFMGEEYGETAPFHYFISHGDPDLVDAVRRGRQDEFREFAWQSEPPDAHDEATFQECRLNHSLKDAEPHRTLRAYYRTLIGLRRSYAPLKFPNRRQIDTSVLEPGRVMAARRWTADQELLIVFHFGAARTTVDAPMRAGRWHKLLDSADDRWLGPGATLPENIESTNGVSLTLAPRSVVVYEKQGGT